MACLNFLIAKTLIDSKKKLVKNHNFKREKQFAFCLFLMNFIFFIFNFPLAITYLLVNIYKDILGFSSDSITMTKVQLAHYLTNALGYAYNSIAFFMNIWFNQSYRREFITMLIAFCIKCKLGFLVSKKYLKSATDANFTRF